MEMTRKQLSIALSKLEGFKDPKTGLEQYTTDPDIAATILWHAYMAGEIEGKTVADLGCGPGILGIGAAELGAKKVLLVEKDPQAAETARHNLDKEEIDDYELLCEDVKDIEIEADIVLQNPPFGTKQKHADKPFLEKAFKTADIIYSFHKTDTKRFVEAISKDNGFTITQEWQFSFPLRKSMKHHKKKVEKIDVTCFRLQKI